MQDILTSVILASFGIACVTVVLGYVGWVLLHLQLNLLRDARFESSDGHWTDNTVEIKGRGFHAVLWAFEAYKLKHDKPDVFLVRITPEPKWPILSSKRQKSDPKWKVPLGQPSGHARQDPLDSYSQQDVEEITRRADLTHEAWKCK